MQTSIGSIFLIDTAKSVSSLLTAATAAAAAFKLSTMAQHLAIPANCYPNLQNTVNCCPSSSSSSSSPSLPSSSLPSPSSVVLSPSFSPTYLYANMPTALNIAKVKRKKQITNEMLHRQRQAANERERKRMCSINKGFDKLRLRLPTLPYEKKLSKVDTLKQAIKYIQALSDMLNDRSPTVREETASLESQQSSTLIVSSPTNPDSEVLSLSWWKSLEQYGQVTRDENGVPHVRCSKVWIPNSLE